MARSSLRDALRERLDDASREFLTNDPGLTGELGSDVIHDSRVALRRARSYLRTFSSLFDRGLAPSVRADLKWYAAYLGGARDVDVVAETLDDLGRALEGDADLAPVLACVADARKDALERLLEAGTLDRHGRVVAHMRALAEVPIAVARSGDVARLFARPWHDLRNAVRQLEHHGDAARLHQVRIRAKDLRYAGEVAAGLEPRLGGPLAEAAQAVQDRIGDHRDALGAAAFIERRVEELGAGAYRAGMLALLARQRAASLLGGLDADLARVRRRYRKLRRALS